MFKHIGGGELGNLTRGLAAEGCLNNFPFKEATFLIKSIFLGIHDMTSNIKTTHNQWIILSSLHYRLSSIKGVRFANFASHFIRVQIFQIDFSLILSTSKYCNAMHCNAVPQWESIYLGETDHPSPLLLEVCAI